MEKKRNRLLQRAVAIAKEEFEREKQEIFNSVPNSYKDHFNEIVLVKWGKSTVLPGLILNPYDVPPEPVRSDWLKMLKNVSLPNFLSVCLSAVAGGVKSRRKRCVALFVHNISLLYALKI